MIVKTSLAFEWDKYPKLRQIFEHRPMNNVYWAELEAMFLDWQAVTRAGRDVSSLVTEADVIVSQKRCQERNGGKHPPVWLEDEILWRCFDCGTVLDPYDYGCVAR